MLFVFFVVLFLTAPPPASAASRITINGSCGLGCKRALFRTRAAHASYLFSY